jgi:hypothetical protein
MSVDDNYAAYRKAIREAPAPAIPYLGINLTDLVFIEDGNRNYLDEQNTVVNFTKVRATIEQACNRERRRGEGYWFNTNLYRICVDALCSQCHLCYGKQEAWLV